MPTQNVFPLSTVPTGPQPSEALERLRPLLLAMPTERIAQVPRVDPRHAVAVVNGSLGRIATQRATVAAELGEARAAILDALPVAVRAALQANVEAAGDLAAEDARELHASLFRDHQLLWIDAQALVRRGLLPRDRVAAGRPAKGYRTVATSVLVLVMAFHDAWAEVAGNTAVRADDLARLESKARRALDHVDRKDVGSLPRPERELRTRALVHLLDVYDQVRKQIQYVRYEKGDADTIAPSPYSGREKRRRRARASADEPKAVEPSEPSEPSLDPEGPSDG